MAISFPKHATLRNIAYTPEGITRVTPDASSPSLYGERCALYEGLNSTGLAPVMIWFALAGAVTSNGAKADTTDQVIATTDGLPWQFLMRGGKVIYAQCRAVKNDGVGGEGYCEPPGTAGGWESTATADSMTWKDIGYIVAHVRAYATRYGINPNAVSIYATSGGLHVSCRAMFGPNMANMWGSGAQHNQSTRPNALIGQHTVIASVKPFDQTSTSNGFANQFESVAVPGTPADAFTDVPAAYLRASELVNICPFWQQNRGPPFFVQGDVAYKSTQFGDPWPAAGTLLVTDGHSMYGAMALKSRKPATKVYLAQAIVGTDILLGQHYDGVLDDISAAGVAGETTGVAIDWLMDAVYTPEFVRTKDEVWTYTGAVLTAGYQAIAPSMNRRVRTLRVTCTHATVACDIGPTQDQATKRCAAAGGTQEFRTAGGLWIKGNAAASSYLVEEYD